MFTDRIWDIIKAYINEAVDSALEERGYTKDEEKKKEKKSTQSQKTGFDEFQEKYDKYKKYQKQSSSSQQSSQQNYKNTQTKSTATDEQKYYQWLELPQGSSFDDIKKSYKVLMKKYHPDNFHNNETKQKTAEKLSQKLNEAYQYFEKKYQKVK